jgi:hypothetical protein
MQGRIGLDPGSDFATIGFRHCDIEEDKVRLKLLSCLMSFVRVVLFRDEIATSHFQRTLGRVGKVAVVIDYQDAWLFERFRDLWEKACFDRSVHDFPQQVVARLSNLFAD